MNNTTRKVASFALAGSIVAGVPVAAHADSTTPEKVIEEVAEATTYVVKEGDTLGKIAERFYGNSDYYKPLAEYNNLKNYSLIFPGQVITLPKTLTLKNDICYDYQNNEVVVYVQQPEVVEQELQVEKTYEGEEDEYYTVKEGDTMYCIVSKFYGSKKQEDVDKLTTYNWYYNSKFTDPNEIYRGQVLRIPPYWALQLVQQHDYTEEYNRMGWKLNHPKGCKPCDKPLWWMPEPVCPPVPVCPPKPCHPVPPCGPEAPVPEGPCGPCLTLKP